MSAHRRNLRYPAYREFVLFLSRRAETVAPAEPDPASRPMNIEQLLLEANS